jgi:hypothetical protein
VFDDKVTDIFDLLVIKGYLLPRFSGARNTLKDKGQWNRIENKYEKIQEYMAASPLPTNGRPPEVLKAITMVFAIRNPQVVTKSDLPTKPKELQRCIHADKTSGLTANHRHLAKLVLALADYVTKLFCHARDPNTPPPNDAPDPLDFHPYHSAAFAAAAGITLESLTQPTAQSAPHFRGGAGGGGGDRGGGAARGVDGGSNAAGWDPHGRDKPEEPDSSIRNADGSLPSTWFCIDAFTLSGCSNSPMFHYKSVPDECVSDLAAAFARVVRALFEAITSEDNARISTAAGWYIAFPQLFLRNPVKDNRNVHTLKLRLQQFLANDFRSVVTYWRTDFNKALAKPRHQSPDTEDTRAV